MCSLDKPDRVQIGAYLAIGFIQRTHVFSVYGNTRVITITYLDEVRSQHGLAGVHAVTVHARVLGGRFWFVVVAHVVVKVGQLRERSRAAGHLTLVRLFAWKPASQFQHGDF